MENISRRGGARPGAGRPSEDLKAITIYVSPDTVSRLDSLSKELGISKGKVVDSLMKWYVEDSDREGE